MTVGELSVNVDADSRNFSSSLNSIRSSGNSWANSFSGNLDSLVGGGFRNVGSIGVAAFGSISTIAKTVIGGIQQIGTSLTQNVTLPLAAAGTAVLKLGKDFESELSKVTGLVGVSSSQVDAWGKEIISLAPEIGRAPQELAEALFFVTSAGIKGAEAMDVLEMSGKAASAGLGETKTVADLVTSAMNAYGKENLSAQEATDILAAAVREGKAEASELASSMGAVLPIASEMGVTFDQVAAAQAAMTKTGTPASEAATQLKSILSGLIKPSQQAEEQLNAMGTSSKELRKSIKEKGLISTLGDLRKLTNKYGEEAMAKVFPNIRALSGVFDLMGSNAKDNVKVFDAVKNSTGSLDEAFTAASETLDFKWNQALSQVQAVALSFYDTLKSAMLPILEAFVTALSWVSEKFTNLSPQMQQFFLILAVAAAAIGPIILALVAIITTLVTTAAVLVAGLTMVIMTFTMIGFALVQVIAVIALVVTAIIGLVAGLIHLWKTNDQFRSNVIETWNYIKVKAKEIFNNIKEIISIVLAKIKSFWKAHGDKIMTIVSNFWNFVLMAIKAAVKIMANVIELALAVIKGDWSGAWKAIKSILSTVWAGIKLVLRNAASAIKVIVSNLVSKILSLMRSLPGKLISIGRKIGDAIKSGVKTGFEWIKNQYSKFKTAGGKIASSIASGIKAGIKKCTDAMSSLVSSVRDFLPFSPAKTGPLKDLNKLNFYDSIKESLDNAKAKISVPATNVAQNIADNLTKGLGETGLTGNNTTSNKSLNISAVNIYGVTDGYETWQTLKNTLRKHSGRLI